MFGVSAPLVVTLELEQTAQDRFDRQRAALFPAGRTQVGAHVTLFHALPGDAVAAVGDDLRAAAERESFAVRVDSVMSLGRGVAYRLVSAELSEVHRVLQRRWWDTLTAQDRQGLRAHVTVQNKVQPEVARSTAAELQTRFRPFDADAIGLLLWRYDGGPWTRLRRLPFQTRPDPDTTHTPGR